jgi:RHS repeat-associated protein
VWQATYKPFGEVQAISGTATQNLRFPGQYFQIETNLAYNHHRHYDPVTGRYTQPDPLRFVDGPSVYAYAGSSPFMNVDPSGLAKCTYSIKTHILSCSTNDGSSGMSVGPEGIFSGGGLLGSGDSKCTNNPECSDKPFTGPVPPGDYGLEPSSKFGGSFWIKENWISRQLCKLRLNRCEFFLHRGTLSNGCITVLKGNNLPNTDRFGTIKNFIDGDIGPHSITVTE